MYIEIIPKLMQISISCKIKNLMKLYKDHANTRKLIEKIKTTKDINTCTMMYNSVTVPFSQFKM